MFKSLGSQGLWSVVASAAPTVSQTSGSIRVIVQLDNRAEVDPSEMDPCIESPPNGVSYLIISFGQIVFLRELKTHENWRRGK